MTNQQETTGALANGGRYRTTGYLVELTDARESVIQTIDANEISGVRRDGPKVTIRRRKGRAVALEAASLDDAGRLEMALRGSVAAPAKRGGFGRVALIGCGGLVALVVLVIVAASLVDSDDDEKQSNGATGQSQAGSNKGDIHVPLVVGSSGEIAPVGNGDRKSRVTLRAIQDNARSSNQLSQPPAGKKYYAIQVEIQNAGSKEVTALDWLMRDTKDNEIKRAFVSGVGENVEPAYTLTPGGKTGGWVVFEVDADASPKWVRADPNPFLKNDLYFDAPAQ